MRCFKLTWDVDAIDGGSKWSMPTPVCPMCARRGGNRGFHYHWLDLNAFSGELDLSLLDGTNRNPLEWAQYEQLRERLSRLASGLQPLPPGTRLGPVVGKVFGKTDFGGPDFRIVCVRERSFVALKEVGVEGMEVAKTELRGYKRGDSPFLLLVAPRSAELAEHCVGRSCPACLLFELPPGKIAVRQDSISAHQPVVRLRQHPAIVLASEKFFESVQTVRLTGLSFEPVEVL